MVAGLSLVAVLLVAALVLSVVSLIQANGKSALGWAVFLVALALVLR